MPGQLVAAVRRVLSALVAFRAPSELAAGLTLGMIIGLMPKGHLIALSLCVLLFSLRVNKGLALASAALFSCVAGWTDPLAHKLGNFVLGAESLQTTYASVYSLPLGPWLGFNNTVVSGSLLMGVYLAYPVYWAFRTVFQRLQARAAT